jgi:hypothetical protein
VNRAFLQKAGRGHIRQRLNDWSVGRGELAVLGGADDVQRADYSASSSAAVAG